MKSKIRWIIRADNNASATVQAFTSKSLVLIIGIFTSIINARFLGPDGRGEQAAMLTLVTFFSALSALGLPASIIYNLKRYPEKQKELLGTCFFWAVSLGLLGSCIGIMVIPTWLSRYSSETIKAAQFFMIGVPFSTITFVCWAVLQARGEFGLINKLNPIPVFITLGLLLFLVGLDMLKPVTSAIVYFAPGIMITFWLLPTIYSKVKPIFSNLRNPSWLLLSYGIRAYGIDVVSILASQIDQLFLVGLISPKSMGLYVVAFSLSRTPGVIQQSIVMVLFPAVAARPAKEVVETVGQFMRISLVGYVCIALLSVLLGPYFIGILYGREFLEISLLFCILIFEVVLNGISQILLQAFMALERPGIVSSSQLLGLCTTSLFMITLVPKYDLHGAGIALLLSSTIRLILVTLSFPFFLRVSPPSFLMNSSDWGKMRSIARGMT